MNPGGRYGLECGETSAPGSSLGDPANSVNACCRRTDVECNKEGFGLPPVEMLLANSPNRAGWAKNAGIGSMPERHKHL